MNVTMHLSIGIVILFSFHILISIVAVFANTCPVTFTERMDASIFANYCTPYILPLERVAERWRKDVCYSKCLPVETCFFYRFSQVTQECLLCVQNPSFIDTISVGISSLNIEATLPRDGEPFQSRIGLAEHILNHSISRMNCETEVYGYPDNADTTQVGVVDIPTGWKLSYIRFCVTATNLKLQGFEYSIRAENQVGQNEDNVTVLCTPNDIWHRDPIHFSDDEYITEIKLFIGTVAIRGIRIRTNLQNYPGFGSLPSSEYADPDSTVIEGEGLTRISYEGNERALYSLQFDFRACY